MGERRGQLDLERSDKRPTRGGRCIAGTGTTDEDDAGGECVAPDSSAASSPLSSYWPRPVDCKARANNGLQKRIPARARRPTLTAALGFRLFECVIDRDGKPWVSLFGQAVHCLGHPVQEERLRLFSAAVTM